MAAERLQKILSAAGVSSRRHAETLIRSGRVSVNGEVVTELGSRADAARDRILVDGRRVRLAARRRYLVLNKPRGFVTALKDPQGRPTILDLLPPGMPRLFHVGRLDFQTEGLLILTDDGELAHLVAHPSGAVEKEYRAKVHGIPDGATLERLRRGVVLEGRRTAPARVEITRSTSRDGNAWLALVLREGRSREVRRMLEAVGHPVSKLRRVRVGPVGARGLKPGSFRELSERELSLLRRAAGASGAHPAPAHPAGPEPSRRKGRGRP